MDSEVYVLQDFLNLLQQSSFYFIIACCLGSGLIIGLITWLVINTSKGNVRNQVHNEGTLVNEDTKPTKKDQD